MRLVYKKISLMLVITLTLSFSYINDIHAAKNTTSNDILAKTNITPQEERETPSSELGYVPGEIIVVYEEDVSESTIEDLVQEQDSSITTTVSAK